MMMELGLPSAVETNLDLVSYSIAAGDSARLACIQWEMIMLG